MTLIPPIWAGASESVAMRLEQILFSQGFGTRHECRGLIALGRAAFGGVVLTDPDDEIDPEGNSVRLFGSMFGRETPIDLELDQVEPVKEE